MQEKTNTVSKTSLYGIIAQVFLVISLKPELVDFLPVGIRDYITGISVLLTFVFNSMTLKNTPDASEVVKNTEDVKKLQDNSEAIVKQKLEIYE